MSYRFATRGVLPWALLVSLLVACNPGGLFGPPFAGEGRVHIGVDLSQPRSMEYSIDHLVVTLTNLETGAESAIERPVGPDDTSVSGLISHLRPGAHAVEVRLYELAEVVGSGAGQVQVVSGQTAEAYIEIGLETGNVLLTAVWDVETRLADIGPGADESYAVAVDSAGRTVAAGRRWDGAKFEAVVVRLLSEGLDLDPTWGIDGALVIDLGQEDSCATGLVVCPGDRIVVAGYAGTAGARDWFFARFDSEGNPDVAFGEGGVAWVHLGANTYLNEIALSADLSLVAVGMTYNGTWDSTLVKLQSSGQLDTMFGGGDGVVHTDWTGTDDQPRAVAVRQGELYVVGAIRSASDQWLIAKHDATTGAPDVTFGAGGLVTLDWPGDDCATACALVGADSLVVAGTARPDGGDSDFAIASVATEDGCLTTDSGPEGYRVFDIGGFDDGDCFLAQFGDELVLAGTTGNGNGSDIAVLYLGPNGSLARDRIIDRADSDYASGVAASFDNRLVIAGFASDEGSANQIEVIWLPQ